MPEDLKATRKFLSHYHGCELRVQQIGPNLWRGFCVLKGEVRPPWTSNGGNEKPAQEAAIAMAHKVLHDWKIQSGETPDWRDLSGMPDEDWNKTLREKGFPIDG